MVPTLIVAGIALGVFVGGGFLRAQKRGRPDTWLYRQLQWRLALRNPALAALLGGTAAAQNPIEVEQLDALDPLEVALHRLGFFPVEREPRELGDSVDLLPADTRHRAQRLLHRDEPGARLRERV